MDVLILDRQCELLAVMDTYESFIWTVRYVGYGDFEIYMPVNTPYLKYFERGNYLSIKGSDRQMVIETIEISTDSENGSHLKVTGRSLESILTRRVVWKNVILSGNFQNGIKKLLDQNVISPLFQNRKIKNFVFVPSEDTTITSLNVSADFLGENLYDAIYDLCYEKGIGFRVLSDGSGGFRFELYSGVDRSYGQDTSPWVVFSPDYDNLLSSNYIDSDVELRTAVLVAGQNDIFVEVVDADGGGKGLDRRETFYESTKGEATIQQTYYYVDEETGEEIIETVTEENPEYRPQLRQEGAEVLADYGVTTSFEGKIENNIQYIYGRDFNIGDIVQVVNEYGMEAISRVSEVVITSDRTGDVVLPTFTAV